MAKYGDWVGPGARFRVVAEHAVYYGDTQATVLVRAYTQVDGDFGGYTTAHNNYYGSDFSLGSGSGNYGDTGWVNLGAKDYGAWIGWGPSTWYTSGSGTTYQSTADDSFVVPKNPDVNAPSNLSYTRVTDNRVNLSWTASTSYHECVCVERKTDGGQWSEVTKLWSRGATSYADTTTSADHSYQYRVRVFNGTYYSDYATSNTVIYMTPSAPTAITLARDASANVAATLVNNTNTAEYLVWEKQAQGYDTWETGGTIQGKVTSFTATSVQGVYKLRAKNTRGSGNNLLESAWLVSDYITTICKPNQPTLVNPSGIVSLADGSITFKWLHNTIDGSAQTAAKLRYKLHSAQQWSEPVSIGTASEYQLESSTFQAGALVDWQVCTKGEFENLPVDDGFSDWSNIGQFNVYQVPSLSFTAGQNPKPPSTVEAMPIPCEVTYSDPQGMACASATVSLYDGQTLMFSEPMDINGNTLSASLDVSEFLPVDGKTYTVVVTARSGSTLQATANTTFTVDYTPPKAATVQITNDAETGYATLLVQEVAGSQGDTISRIDVYRVTDHRQTLLSDAAVGQSFVDRYAPLNTPYHYEIVTYASSGAILATIANNTLQTNRWFAYWGDNLAYAIWNPEEGGIELSRPEKVHVRYSGRRDPVSYDGSAFGESRSMGFTIIDKERVPAFRQLMDDGGRGVFKSCDGDVYHADFGVSLAPEYTERGYYGGVEVSITRIAGDSL